MRYFSAVQYSTVCTQVGEIPRVPRWAALHAAICSVNYSDVEWWLDYLPQWEIILASPSDQDRADRAVQGSGDSRQ